MATAAITGRTAVLRFSTNLSQATSSMVKVVELRDVTLSMNRKEIDVTSHDSSGFKEILYGIMDAKLTGKVSYVSTAAGQNGVVKQLIASAPLKMKASVAATTKTSKAKFEFTCIISKFEMGHPTDKEALGTIEAIGSGAVTRTS